MAYQEVYGVGLLDDLHNYFPALLYDTDRFMNIHQIFQYIREQINNRFNLFDYGRQLYNDTNPIRTRVFQGSRMGSPMRVFGQPGYNFFEREPAVPAAPAAGQENDFDFLVRLLANPLIRLNPVHLNPRAPVWQPVLVRPSQLVLEENTRVMEGVVDTCAICQDSITANESCRLLIPCRHRFHRVCIDQWFQRSVYCPTCRHDIREPAEQVEPPEQ